MRPGLPWWSGHRVAPLGHGLQGAAQQLPLRVLGSAVTKITREGRATAPSWPSTTFITSPSKLQACGVAVQSAGVARHGKRPWPPGPEAVGHPTTATSAMLGWDEMDSSISRARRWPATLITSSVTAQDEVVAVGVADAPVEGAVDQAARNALPVGVDETLVVAHTVCMQPGGSGPSMATRPSGWARSAPCPSLRRSA